MVIDTGDAVAARTALAVHQCAYDVAQSAERQVDLGSLLQAVTWQQQQQQQQWQGMPVMCGLRNLHATQLHCWQLQRHQPCRKQQPTTCNSEDSAAVKLRRLFSIM
jgi:hypothetical protein